jgi:hypothetical protein
MTIPEAPPMPPLGNTTKEKLPIDADLVKENKEFRRHFKTIPTDEYIIALPFKGSVSRPSVSDGKFWISENHLCFKANWPSNYSLCVDFTTITNIRVLPVQFIFKKTIAVETEKDNIFIGNISDMNGFLKAVNSRWDALVEVFAI